jgi:hypothetical protein
MSLDNRLGRIERALAAEPGISAAEMAELFAFIETRPADEQGAFWRVGAAKYVPAFAAAQGDALAPQVGDLDTYNRVLDAFAASLRAA